MAVSNAYVNDLGLFICANVYCTEYVIFIVLSQK